MKEAAVRGQLTRLRQVNIKGGTRRIEGPKNLRVVEIVDEIALLEREPVSAEIVGNFGVISHETLKPLSIRWKEDLFSEATVGCASDLDAWGNVLIRVYPHNRRAEPAEVAVRYEEALTEEGIPYGKSCKALLEYELTWHCLHLLIAPGARGLAPSDRGGFPSPSLVGNIFRGLSQEFEERLTTRRAGGVR